MKIQKRGFTLLELIVVIAIIGILAAVVLALTSGVRDRAADAGVKADLTTLYKQVNLLYNLNNKDYGAIITDTACTSPDTDARVLDAINAAKSSGGGTAFCASSPTAWVVAVNLRSDPGKYWCVDSTGQSKGLDGVPTAPVSCGN